MLLGAGVLVNYIDRINLSVAAPQLQKEFNLSPEELGLLFSAFFWSYSLCGCPGGLVLDRFGVMKVGRWGAFLWAVASTITAISSGFGGIFAARVLLGVAEAPAFPASQKATGTGSTAGVGISVTYRTTTKMSTDQDSLRDADHAAGSVSNRLERQAHASACWGRNDRQHAETVQHRQPTGDQVSRGSGAWWRRRSRPSDRTCCPLELAETAAPFLQSRPECRHRMAKAPVITIGSCCTAASFETERVAQLDEVSRRSCRLFQASTASPGMVTLYSSSIVMMISTRSSDVTPSSDRTDSGLITDGSKWACLAITLVITSVIVSPMSHLPSLFLFDTGHQRRLICLSQPGRWAPPNPPPRSVRALREEPRVGKRSGSRTSRQPWRAHG